MTKTPILQQAPKPANSRASTPAEYCRAINSAVFGGLQVSSFGTDSEADPVADLLKGYRRVCARDFEDFFPSRGVGN